MTKVNNIILLILKVLGKILKFLSSKKKICNYVCWQILTRHCDDQLAIHTSTESLCIPETNTMFMSLTYLNKNVYVNNEGGMWLVVY